MKYFLKTLLYYVRVKIKFDSHSAYIKLSEIPIINIRRQYIILISHRLDIMS